VRCSRFDLQFFCDSQRRAREYPRLWGFVLWTMTTRSFIATDLAPGCAADDLLGDKIDSVMRTTLWSGIPSGVEARSLEAL